MESTIKSPVVLSVNQKNKMGKKNKFDGFFGDTLAFAFVLFIATQHFPDTLFIRILGAGFFGAIAALSKRIPEII